VKKLSDIGAIAYLVMIILSYIVFSFDFEITREKLNIMYALTGHVSWIVVALILLIESNNHIVRFLSLYTAIFFFLAILLFVYVGIIENKSYFNYKLCIYLSIILASVYEAFSFIRKYAASHKYDFGRCCKFIVFCRGIFLSKDKGK
jgi:hypothetical protein